MSEHLINSLQVLFNNLVKLLSSYLDKILSALEPLKRLPDLVESLGKKIVEGFRDQIQAMGEMEIYIRLSQIRSRRILISEEEVSIKELEKQLEEDLKEVYTKYDKIQQELNQEAHDRVRELDKHLLDLYEKYFPMIFSNPFSGRIEPYYDEYFASTRDAYEERITHFWDHVSQLMEALQNFLQARKYYTTNVESFLHQYKLQNPEHFFLPIIFVEYEDREKGSTVRETHLPYYFKLNAATKTIEEINPEITTASDFIPIFEHIKNNETLRSYLKWKPAENLKEDLIAKINKLLNENYISKELLKGFKKNIQKSEIETLG